MDQAIIKFRVEWHDYFSASAIVEAESFLDAVAQSQVLDQDKWDLTAMKQVFHVYHHDEKGADGVPGAQTWIGPVEPNSAMMSDGSRRRYEVSDFFMAMMAREYAAYSKEEAKQMANLSDQGWCEIYTLKKKHVRAL